MPKIGAHVSAAVSLALSFERAQEIGAVCSQIFISPPQRWMQLKHSDEVIKSYRDKQTEANIGPNFIHGAYLINLATSDPLNLQKSIDWLIHALVMAEKLGITGVIFHLGSGKERTFEQCLDQIVDSIKKILQNSSTSFLILENCAGAGNLIGDNLKELGQIIKKVGDERLKVCLDTQHLFASGYAVQSEDGLNNLLSEFDKEIGLDRLVAIHTNDSKTEFNSKRDRHENIGEGLIGLEAFRIWLNHPKLQNIPFILEVPGITDSGPDKENIDILRSLAYK